MSRIPKFDEHMKRFIFKIGSWVSRREGVLFFQTFLDTKQSVSLRFFEGPEGFNDIHFMEGSNVI